MNTHTPSPWEYRPLQFDDWGWVRGPKDNEGNQAIVACARSGTLDGEDLDSHRRNGTDPWEANARLIAAAPELLDVLKAFVAQEVDYMTINNLGDPEQQHNVIWARKVIAKVEWRSMPHPKGTE